jgi:formyl-CoA transferase
MPGALDGVTVVEMANFISGPMAGMMLADLGARVIKVEIPGSGDPFRQWGERRGKNRPQFAAYNRGKESLTVNIKADAGREVMLRLLRSADVFLENNRPGALDRAGLGWEAVSAINPRLIYCSVNGFGSAGPYRDRPTYDAIAQAISGFQSQFTDMTDPRPLGPASSDQLTAMYAAFGIVSALYARQQTGRGQRLEVNMMAASMAFLTEPVANYLIEGEISDPHLRPKRSQSYAVIAGDGKPLGIHLSSPHKFWVGLCTAMGRLDLMEDERFKEQPSRVRNYDALRAEITEAFKARPRDEWLALLLEHDVPVAAINTIPEALADEQAQFLGIAEYVGEGERRVGLAKSPIDFSGTAYRAELPPPDIGEHNTAILGALGYDAAAADQMQRDGAI